MTVHTSVGRTVAGLFLFGISFGYVEAAVVVYLRTIYEPLRRQLSPGPAAGDIFPLLDLKKLQSEEPKAARLLPIELAREAATLVMLTAAGLAAANSRVQVLPSLAVAFGVWDITFYVFLKLLIGWPASLLTWDLLFLLPVPWVAPVLAPVLVSLSLIVCGLAALLGTLHMRRLHWLGLVLGALTVLVSFMLDFRNILAGSLPHDFPWALFTTGEVLGLGAFLHAMRQSASVR
jgi:hypothetical protein